MQSTITFEQTKHMNKYITERILNDGRINPRAAGNKQDTIHSVENASNKKTNNNDLLEKDGGTKNCIYKD